jgi:hypothetical protein
MILETALKVMFGDCEFKIGVTELCLLTFTLLVWNNFGIPFDSIKYNGSLILFPDLLTTA